jgi:hypothetical protein
VKARQSPLILVYRLPDGDIQERTTAVDAAVKLR